MSNTADLILFNANVLSMDGFAHPSGFVAVCGDRILDIGADDDWRSFAGKRTEVIDCAGRPLLPGFHDAHMHIFALVSDLLSVDCSPLRVSSISDIEAAISTRTREVKPGEWVRATGYNEFSLAERRHPTRWDLDKAAPGHPVKLSHRTRHACVLNSMALEIAGITAETPEPDGCIIERDLETGQPNGVLYGMNAYLTDTLLPPRTAAEMDEGLRMADRILCEAGITSIQDATSHNGVAQWNYLQKVKGEGKLSPRVTMMFGFDSLGQFLEMGLAAGSGDEQLNLGMVKILVDEVRGPLNPPQEVLREMVLATHRSGFQSAIHAIEEATVIAASEAIGYAIRELPRIDHRHRIEHCSECPSYLLEELKKIGVVVVTQPAFLYYSGDRYLTEVEPHKQPWLYRMGSLSRCGVMVAASSDAPVVPPSPLTGIYAAVTRKSRSGQILSTEESVTALQALWMYTLGGAYAARQENQKGSITPGKLADMVLLSHDPTAVPAEGVKDIRVEKTVIGGKVVWERA